MFKLFRWLSFLGLLAFQTPNTGPNTGIVRCTVNNPLIVKAGAVCDVVVTVDVQNGWHIYAPEAVNSNEGLTTTRITMELPKGFSLSSKTVFPAPIPYGKYMVFQGDGIKIDQSVRIEADVTPGLYQCKVKVRYQACSSSLCITPRNESLQLNIEVQ